MAIPHTVFSAGGGTASFTTANATRFITMGGIGAQLPATPGATEASHKSRIRGAGDVSRLGCRVTVNTWDNAPVLKVRKNGADTTLTLTLTALTTGWFVTGPTGVSFADGDDINLALTTLAGAVKNLNIGAINMRWNPVTGVHNYRQWACRNSGGLSFSVAGVTRFGPLAGGQGTATPEATESRFQTKVKVAGVLAKLQCNVLTNTRSDATTILTRKNGAAGAQSISVAAAATGQFEDTTNSDTVAVDDLFNYGVTLGAGTGAIVMLHITSRLASNSTDFETGNASNSTSHGMTVNVPNYFPVGGDIDGMSTTESTYQQSFPQSLRADRLRVRVTTNSATNSVACNLRQSASNTGVGVTVPGSTTGLFEDTSNFAVISGNCNYMWDSPNNAGVAISLVSLRLNSSTGANTGNPGTFLGIGALPGQ